MISSQSRTSARKSEPTRLRRENWAPKPKNFSLQLLFGGGVWGGADKKWKGKFFVLVSPL